MNLQWKKVQRCFRKALRTAHGDFATRESLILRLETGCGVGFGEVAPWPDFNTETLEIALKFLKNFQPEPNSDPAHSIPDELPCCQFALSSAFRMMKHPEPSSADPIPVARLLPAGAAVLGALEQLNPNADIPAAKWKIAVEAAEIEWDLLRAVHERLPPTTELRLDANGGLDTDTARVWLERLEALPRPGLLEQPLPTSRESSMRRLAAEFRTPLYLDESASGFSALASLMSDGWTGGLVVKPSISGNPAGWDRFRAQFPRCPVLFSSVFESAFGIEAILRWLPQAGPNPAALGFGTIAAFKEDGLTLHPINASLTPGLVSTHQLDALWQQL